LLDASATDEVLMYQNNLAAFLALALSDENPNNTLTNPCFVSIIIVFYLEAGAWYGRAVWYLKRINLIRAYLKTAVRSMQ